MKLRYNHVSIAHIKQIYSIAGQPYTVFGQWEWWLIYAMLINKIPIKSDLIEVASHTNNMAILSLTIISPVRSEWFMCHSKLEYNQINCKNTHTLVRGSSRHLFTVNFPNGTFFLSLISHLVWTYFIRFYLHKSFKTTRHRTNETDGKINKSRNHVRFAWFLRDIMIFFFDLAASFSACLCLFWIWKKK